MNESTSTEGKVDPGRWEQWLMGRALQVIYEWEGFYAMSLNNDIHGRWFVKAYSTMRPLRMEHGPGEHFDTPTAALEDAARRIKIGSS